MNNIHNNGENDQSLNDGLDKLSHAYGQLDQEEPPELLDQAILNSAHRAVEKKPRWMKFGWLHGLTTAAVFVLAFTVVMDQRESAPVFENGMRSTEPLRLQSEKPARKRAIESRLSSYVQDVMKTKKAEAVNKDMETGDVIHEEVSLDEADYIANAPKLDEAKRQAAPAAVAAAPLKGPNESGAWAREQSMLEAEQRLQAIIKLKQAGDPGWEAELESFMESYPDYPLPKELKDP